MLKWILQKNLIKQRTLVAIRNAFVDLGINFEEVLIVPFSKDLPVFDPAENQIFYGSMTLMMNAYHSEYRRGVFFDPYQFNFQNYLNKWPNHMLNSDATIQTLDHFVASLSKARTSWFIRPNSDDKSFVGSVMNLKEIQEFHHKVTALQDSDVNGSTLVCTAPPKHIIREWRTFVVDGKVIDSCRYILNGKLNPSAEDVPKAIVNFVELRAAEYSPHPVFVMDVAETPDGLRIIECNCFNGTGFYDNNVHKIIEAVHSWASKNLSN